MKLDIESDIEIFINDQTNLIRIYTDEPLTYGLVTKLMDSLRKKFGKSGLDISEYNFEFNVLKNKL